MKSRWLLFVAINGCYAATTVELLDDNPNVSMFVGLVRTAGIVDTLNRGTYTIFAPTNAAFQKLPDGSRTALSSDTQALANVLLYHVVQVQVLSGAIKDELKKTTMNGKVVRFNIYSHNNFSFLPTEDGVTFYAPTNAAFAKLSTATISKITSNPKTLYDVLAYHAIGRTHYSKGLYDRERLTCLDRQENSVLVQQSARQRRMRINSAQVTKTDISATNGVIHEIDTVLLR